MVTKYLSVKQLAQTLGLPASWIRREALAGRLPCLRAGRSLRFDLAQVEASLARAASKGVKHGA